MKREDDQELWDLLGKARQPEQLSPFFARNVVRQAREENERRGSWPAWLRPAWLVPGTAVAAAVIVTAFSLQPRTAREIPAEDPPELIASLDPEDYEVVADLDELLLELEDDNLWNESS